jgi:hypothetical protein
MHVRFDLLGVQKAFDICDACSTMVPSYICGRQGCQAKTAWLQSN